MSDNAKPNDDLDAADAFTEMGIYALLVLGVGVIGCVVSGMLSAAGVFSVFSFITWIAALVVVLSLLALAGQYPGNKYIVKILSILLMPIVITVVTVFVLVPHYDKTSAPTPVRVVTASHANKSTLPNVFVTAPETAAVNTPVTITALVTSSSGAPVRNADVTFSIQSGSCFDNAPTGIQTSGSGSSPNNGKCVLIDQTAITNVQGIATLRLSSPVAWYLYIGVEGLNKEAAPSQFGSVANTYYLVTDQLTWPGVAFDRHTSRKQGSLFLPSKGAAWVMLFYRR